MAKFHFAFNPRLIHTALSNFVCVCVYLIRRKIFVETKMTLNRETEVPTTFWRFLFRLKGTVVAKIWTQGLLLTIYTAVIVALHEYVGWRMNYPLYLISIIGFVTSLLLVFRTNTAYDRYWEGRKLWSKMTSSIRSLTLGIWAGVEEGSQQQGTVNGNGGGKEMIEKVCFINLLVAFAYATKNYLRGEYSYDSDETLKSLIGHLPKFQTPSSNESLTEQRNYPKRKTSLNPDKKGAHVEVPLSDPNGMDKEDKLTKKNGQQQQNNRKCSRRCIGLMAYDRVTPSNIPLEISYLLLSHFRNKGCNSVKDHSLTKHMYHSIFDLIDCLTGFERILRTPIPLAYSVHLHYTVWLYLLSLPYQLVGQLSWLTVPVVALASFALLGILWIGWEIENPFGYDDNDLPLDDFCKVIHRECQVIMRNPLPTLDSWTLSKDNHPFAPMSWVSAEELAQKSVAELRQLLGNGTESTSPFSGNADDDEPAT